MNGRWWPYVTRFVVPTRAAVHIAVYHGTITLLAVRTPTVSIILGSRRSRRVVPNGTITVIPDPAIRRTVIRAPVVPEPADPAKCYLSEKAVR